MQTDEGMRLPSILEHCALRSGATAAALRDAELRLGHALPDDYVAVMRETDGLEGFVGADAYVSLGSVTELAGLNDGYAVAELVPGVTLLGTDGGDTGYGFRRTGAQVEYVSVPLVGMEPSAVSVVGTTLTELLEAVAR